ncbi:transcription termination/antitermination NusG family protein [Candidatus Stoquefichus sp. SB1]|uniref:transcription termination/antitermination NusG family protein n=1 Tax=Candidatus Stoquefichus sp. SB1 TaxID=1658109 RepID=UPI00067F2E21|nr:transcription termination/antitermination NusG family protein [Candidatus Stoquefichus sp. SB1]
MNWYVLYTLSQKSNKIITNLNRKKELIAFIPEYEICHRKTKEITIKPMFSNYIFVKTDLNQSEFNDLLLKMKDENDGLIKQLKNCETSALRESEIEFFQMILDEQYIVRLSYGYQENGITHVTKGPLKPFEKHIVKVDKHNQCAYLDLLFFDRRIMLGIDIKCKN